MKLVLSHLKKIRLRLDILKYKFHVTEVKFLRLMVTSDKIKINLKKITQIKN